MCSSSCFGGLCYVDAFVHLLLFCSLVFRLSRRIYPFACWLSKMFREVVVSQLLYAVSR
jgi:hypothetical protein